MLRARKAKKYYKDTNAWLDAVYRNNKQVIDKALQSTRWSSSKKIFKEWIRAYIAEGNSPAKALRKLSRSEIFTDRATRLKENFLKGLKADKEKFKEFRKKIGWRTKIDINKLKYDYQEGAYVYEGADVEVYEDPSPKGKRGGTFQISSR